MNSIKELEKDPEALLIGHLLNHPEDIPSVSNSLNPEHFFHSNLKKLFKFITNSYFKGILFDPVILIEELKLSGDLDFIGGSNLILTLFAIGWGGLDVDHYNKIIKQKFVQRKLKALLKKSNDLLINEFYSSNDVINELQIELSSLEKSTNFTPHSSSIQDRLKEIDEMFKLYRGKKYIGLCQKTIPEFDDNLLGLRKLILLAAQPNVGKTALTVQLALDTVKNNPDACMIYFSLEMSSKDIVLRMLCNLAQIDYKTLVFGNLNQDRSIDPEAYFSKEELQSIQNAKEILLKMGERIQVFDMKTLPTLDSRSAISIINKTKESSNCSRVIVIIDYLQVWPLDQNTRFASEVEIDKWRIGEMKKIRDAVNDDPVIVISEARKPSGNEEIWADNMSAVMGSARGTYTPDVVMLFGPISDKEFEKLISACSTKIPGNSQEEKIEHLKSILYKKGMALGKIKVPKARDGMNKFSIFLEFDFFKNSFRSLDLSNLNSYLEKLIQDDSIKSFGPIKIFSKKAK